MQKFLVIDDETYIPHNPSDVPGKEYFHAADRDEVDYSQKVVPKAKFYKKYLVWQAINENGDVSEPLICEGSLNSQTYLQECVKKGLLPFIDKHYNCEDILFWPDLGTSHYANSVTEYLREQKVEFVPKNSNPPNVPQTRGIKMFWAECKREYKKLPKAPKNLRGFRQVWKRISKSVAKKVGKVVMDKAYKNL